MLLFELDNLTHDYGRVRALTDITLQVEQGAVGLVGQNGAGKSTLMQVLLGLVSPSRGRATVLGLDVARGGLELRGRVGYMPERDALVPGLQGVELVALAGELSGMPRKQALRRGHETLSYLGLEDARYRKVDQYSVGMIQRLKLAAALVHDPELLLLDEPTAGLDPDGRTAMLRLLASLAARPNKSLLLSTHLLGDIERVCKSAIILDRGQVLRQGRIEEFKLKQRRCYRLRWQGEATGFVEALVAQGAACEGRPSTSEARFVVDQNWSTQAFFAAAHQQGLLLTAVEPEEEDLESVYHRLVGGNGRPPVIDAVAVRGVLESLEAVGHRRQDGRAAPIAAEKEPPNAPAVPPAPIPPPSDEGPAE